MDDKLFLGMLCEDTSSLALTDFDKFFNDYMMKYGMLPDVMYVQKNIYDRIMDLMFACNRNLKKSGEEISFVFFGRPVVFKEK